MGIGLVRLMGFNKGALKDKIHVIDCHRVCVCAKQTAWTSKAMPIFLQSAEEKEKKSDGVCVSE